MGFSATALAWVDARTRSYTGIQFAAVGLSLLLTVVIVAQDHMPNDDGVVYLYSAELIASGRWDDALQLFNWPFYSLLIATIHQATGLAVETSAYVLNGVLQALLVYAFVAVAAALGGDKKVILSAVMLVLIFPGLNDYRDAIIRDFGYWAFALLGLLWLLKSAGGRRPVAVIAWTISLILAALFRVEGLVLLATFPLLLLLCSDIGRGARIRRVSTLYGAYIAIALGLLLVATLAGVDVVSVQQWNKPFEILDDFYAAVSSDLASRAQILRDHYLIRYAHEHAWTIVFTTILVILLSELVASLGLVFVVFAGYGLLRSRTTMHADGRSMLLGLIGLHFLMLAAFVAMLGFLTGRYPLGLTLLLLLFAAFGVLPLYERLRQWADVRGRARWASALFVLAAVYFLVDGAATTSPGKVHVEQAANWLRSNLTAADRVLSIDYPLLYRAGKIEFDDYLALRDQTSAGGNLRLMKKVPFSSRLTESDWTAYQYVATTISRKDPLEQGRLEQVLGVAPLKEFRNRKGDRVMIYKTAPSPDGADTD